MRWNCAVLVGLLSFSGCNCFQPVSDGAGGGAGGGQPRTCSDAGIPLTCATDCDCPATGRWGCQEGHCAPVGRLRICTDGGSPRCSTGASGSSGGGGSGGGLGNADGGTCAETCPGCCTASGVCIEPANTVLGCGSAGKACVTCSPSTEDCVGGACVVGSCDGGSAERFDRACAADTDCAVIQHRLDCCGSEIELGVASSGLAADRRLEDTCVGPPRCECLALLTVAEDGNKVLDPASVKVRCSAGRCVSFVAGGLNSNCASTSECQLGLLCCYPCGIPGCHDACLAPVNGGCPLIP